MKGNSICNISMQLIVPLKQKLLGVEKPKKNNNNQACFCWKCKLCRRVKALERPLSALVISLSDLYSHVLQLPLIFSETSISVIFLLFLSEMFYPPWPLMPLSLQPCLCVSSLFSRPLVVNWLQIITAIWLQFSQPVLSAGTYRGGTCQADALNCLCREQT